MMQYFTTNKLTELTFEQAYLGSIAKNATSVILTVSYKSVCPFCQAEVKTQITQTLNI